MNILKMGDEYKSKRTYRRTYNFEKREETNQRVPLNPNDNITKELEDIAISLIRGDLKQEFLWYDGKRLMKIAVSKIPDFKRFQYERVVTIETMPSEQELPSGLLRLLKDFKSD